MTDFDQNKAAAILADMAKGTGLARAVALQRIPVHEVERWRWLGVCHGHESALKFHKDLLAAEASLVSEAEKRLGELMAAKRPAPKSARAERQDMNVQLSAVLWCLERRCVDYSGTLPVKQAIRRAAATELLGFLAERIPADAFAQVQDVLSGRTPALER